MCSRQRPARGRLAATLGDRRERGQGGVQEPAEPDALALALVADPVHAVVPVAGADQRQAVRADRQAAIERRARSARRACRALARSSAGSRRRPAPARARALEERHGSSRMRCVAGDLDVVGDGVRQPEPVVGDPRAHAAARTADATSAARRLRRTGCAAARSRCSRASSRSRDRRAPSRPAADRGTRTRRRPGRSRPRPEAAGQRLVEQPAVEHDVHRAVGRPDLDGARACRPSSVADGPQRRRVIGAATRARSSSRGFRAVRRACPSRTTTSSVLPGGELEARLQRGAGIEAGADTPRRRLPRSSAGGRRERRCGRGTRCDRPSRQSGARRGPRRRRGRRTRCSTGCARASRPRLGVELGDDAGRRRAPRTSQRPTPHRP